MRRLVSGLCRTPYSEDTATANVSAELRAVSAREYASATNDTGGMSGVLANAIEARTTEFESGETMQLKAQPP